MFATLVDKIRHGRFLNINKDCVDSAKSNDFFICKVYNNFEFNADEKTIGQMLIQRVCGG